MLCPVYSAGEKIDRNFNQDHFSRFITKKSGTQVINIKNKNELKIFLKKIYLTMNLLFVWELEVFQTG